MKLLGRCKIGIELEFYSTKTLSDLQNFIKGKFTTIKTVIEESENSQYEIITDPTYDLELLVREVNLFKEASQCDFRAKPFLDRAGSALHVNISLHDPISDENTMDEETTRHIIGGLCHGIKSSMIYFAPSVESYRRFQYYDKFTPRFATWGFDKSNAIRLRKCIIEHRVPCADSNLNDVLRCILESAEYGLINKLNPADANFAEPKYSRNFNCRIPLSLHEAFYLRAQIGWEHHYHIYSVLVAPNQRFVRIASL